MLYLISSLNVSNFFAYLYNCFNILCLIVALFVSTSAARKGKSLFLFLFLLPLIIGSVASFLASNIQDLSSWLLFFYTTLLTAISVPIMLLGGVVKAAKAQENYLPLKNILFLVLLLTTVGLFFVDLKIQIILIYYYSLILSPLLFSYLIEDVHPIADKKLREGQSGMVLLKYSGWPGGLFYFFIFSFVSFLIFFFSINYPTTGIKGQIIAYIYTVASLFSPMPFYWLFVNNKRGFSPIFYIIFQSIMVFLSTSFGYFESIGVIENYIFPQVELINLITESKTDFNDLNPFPLISCFILFYITILAVRRLIRSYRVSSS